MVRVEALVFDQVVSIQPVLMGTSKKLPEEKVMLLEHWDISCTKLNAVPITCIKSTYVLFIVFV